MDTLSMYHSADQFSKLLENGLLIFGKIIPWKTCMVCLKFTDVMKSYKNENDIKGPIGV